MKSIFVLMMMVFGPAARAEVYNCDLSRLSDGGPVRSFAVRPPSQGRITTTLPGNRFRVDVWIYEASVGVQVLNLATHFTELSTQMTFDSAGVFDLTFGSADFRLTCGSN